MTVLGYERLKAQLKQIMEIDRPQNVRDIEEARAHGDLSENAEYHAAKDRQGMLDAQMRDIKSKLSRAQVIDPKTLSGDRVVFGSTVTLEDLDNETEVVYQIVGVDEASPSKGKISNSSPVARAIIAKQINDVVYVKAPAGIREYEIIDIQFL